MPRLFRQYKVDVTQAQSEISRITLLPRRAPVDCDAQRGKGGQKFYAPATQALIEVMTEKFALERPPLADGRGACSCREVLGLPCITALNPMQAWWLRELRKTSGGIGFSGTGSGKTIALLLAILAVEGRRVGVLLAKPDQRLHYQKAWRRLREHFRVPSLVFDDGSPSLISPQRGAPVLHFLPYSRLARPESTVLLEEKNPDFVAADELHKLSGDSATARRFKRFMAEHEEDVVFCGASGSLLTKTMQSVWHLLAYSLGHGSPYPINPSDAEAWAYVVDPSYQPDKESATAQLLYEEFAQVRDTGKIVVFSSALSRLRAGLQQRLIETHGVVATRASSSPASLTIRERKVKIPPLVEEAIRDVRLKCLRPDGEVLAEALDQVECAKEVGAGFYFYWAWPRGEPDELILEWFAARKSWFHDVRLKVAEGLPHLDSVKLCEDAAKRALDETYEGSLPRWLVESWPRWEVVRDRVEHEERVAWISGCPNCKTILMPAGRGKYRCEKCDYVGRGDPVGDFLINDAAQWAKENTGIIWCLSTEFGQRIAAKAGISFHAGGQGAEGRILAESGRKSIVAKIQAHGTGRDGLQEKFVKQLIAETPSGGDIWEQMLARLCRQGQQAEEVETWVYFHISENRNSFRNAYDEAEFAEAMTLNEQLLLAADLTFKV